MILPTSSPETRTPQLLFLDRIPAQTSPSLFRSTSMAPLPRAKAFVDAMKDESFDPTLNPRPGLGFGSLKIQVPPCHSLSLPTLSRFFWDQIEEFPAWFCITAHFAVPRYEIPFRVTLQFAWPRCAWLAPDFECQ
ncbi:hypothetical protein NL676_029575 [Syzygium grande]|nr:hypothetical protein NL676_029575 [Syzygium grande]